jgi:ligand-binding sensor protein
MKLSDIIDLDALQSIQDCFSRATGFAAVTVDYRGRPLLEYSGFCRFCTKLREDPYYNERCRQSDAYGSLEAVRRNSAYIYKCHSGLIDLAIPIIVEGEYVASMLCGQVRAEETPEVEPDLISPAHNLLSDDPELQEEFDKVTIVPLQRIHETANLLSLTLNYIVEQYILNKKNIRLLQDRMDKADMEKQIRDLELSRQHPRINPYVLFSAMNIAGRQAYMENAQKTQEIIFAMADMYRGFLNYSESLITVEQELGNLNNYIFIQKARFGDLLRFSISVPGILRNHMIPAMSLQVFVENAVLHGLEPKEDMGEVRVSGALKNGKLVFEITDDGVGIPQKYIDILNSSSFTEMRLPDKMGTDIQHALQRLRYFYPDAFSVRFLNGSPTGTRVILSLPAERSRRSPFDERFEEDA